MVRASIRRLFIRCGSPPTTSGANRAIRAIRYQPICGSPILIPPERPTFNEPWEAQAFAMAVSLNEKGLFTWTEWAAALAAEISADESRPYYESWLAALEKLVEAKSMMTGKERLARIEAWDRAARATPHGKPIELR
ncbi:MAG: nitrile hydratase accessory protein [Alphaproteobacteria bacterium]|nr:MAG: nitrile hydratase accessory protein [Alphaproteobacteria bacterium]